MKEMGVGEDNFGLFISDVYNKCKNIGIQPEYISYNMKQILDLAGFIPLSQIPGIDRQSFVSELDKYGGLKSAIEKLTESDRQVRYKRRSEALTQIIK